MALPLAAAICSLSAMLRRLRQTIQRCGMRDRKSTRLNSSHSQISYAVLCLKKNRDIFMHRQKTGARAEYRQQETQRIKDSASLADKFPRLKSLTVDLTYYDPKGVTRSSQIKYKVTSPTPSQCSASIASTTNAFEATLI